MQKRKIIPLFLVLAGLLFLFSCEYETIEPEIVPTDTISYSASIQPIWNKSCTGCHGPNRTPPDLSSANSYQSLITGGYINTGDPASSTIYEVMASGGSMSSYANTSEANLVLQWIRQGALNN